MKLMSAAFDALYGGSVCEPICPATDAISRIEPVFASQEMRREGVHDIDRPLHVDLHDPRPIARLQIPEREAELAGADADGVDEMIDRAEFASDNWSAACCMAS